MSPLGGKLVWVRDPALADDEVFVKGRVINEDEKQVRLTSCARTRHYLPCGHMAIMCW